MTMANDKDMNETTKSVVLKYYGDYNSLSVMEFPLPPLEGRIEVDVQFCGVNFSDLYTRLGLFRRDLPFVLGSECCGIVTAVGCEGNDFKVGQHVVCYDYTGGMYRNTVRTTPDHCYILPEGISFEDGAALFVNYLTAYFSLFELGNLKPWENVLIKSCAGGVGWAATQLARTLQGVKIYGVASLSKHEIVKQNGVLDVFDYATFKTRVKTVCPNGFDLIIDNQSGDSLNECSQLLKPLGRLVLIGANSLVTDQRKISYFSLAKLWWSSQIFSLSSLVQHNGVIAGLHLGILAEKEPEKVKKNFEYICHLLFTGRIKPRIDSVWPMDDVVKATKVLAERRNVGKVLLSTKKTNTSS